MGWQRVCLWVVMETQKTKVQNQTQKVAKPKVKFGAISSLPPKPNLDLEISISLNLVQSCSGGVCVQHRRGEPRGSGRPRCARYLLTCGHTRGT